MRVFHIVLSYILGCFIVSLAASGINDFILPFGVLALFILLMLWIKVDNPKIIIFIKTGIASLLTAFVLFIFLIISLGIALSKPDWLIFLVMPLGVVFVLAIPLVFHSVLRVKTFFKIIIADSAAVFLIILSIVLYDNYERKILVISDYMYAHDYQPYREDLPLAALDAAPALHIDDNFPRMDGATALYPVYAAFAKALYPEELLTGELQYETYDAASTVACTKTPEAYAALISGERDIIFVAAPSQAQMEKAAEAGQELVFTPIGKEGFVFFVNAKNPVNSLTVEEIQKIYSGEIVSWRELGGKNKEIKAFQRNEGSGSQSALVRFMGDVPLREPLYDDYQGGMGRIIEVASYKNYSNSIGFSFRFFATVMNDNAGIKLLAVDGIAPSKENISSGAYPLSSNFYAVTVKGNSNPHLQNMLGWILSPQGQEIIEKTGYSGL